MTADPGSHSEEFTGRTNTPATIQLKRIYLNLPQFQPRGLNPEARAFLPAAKVGSGNRFIHLDPVCELIQSIIMN